MAVVAYLGAKVTPAGRAPPYFSTLCFAGFSISDPESEAPLAQTVPFWWAESSLYPL